MAEQNAHEPRPWVVRLGSYLRIFGKPAPGTMGWKTAPEYIDGLIRTAKEREDEFGSEVTDA